MSRKNKPNNPMTMIKKGDEGPFHSTKDEIAKISAANPVHYELAFTDTEFLLREELRPVRLQLELLRPELVLQDHKISKTIVVFGSARIPSEEIALQKLRDTQANLKSKPDDRALQRAAFCAERVYRNSQYLKEASKLAYLVSSDEKSDFVIVTGGGPSFMEAANRGAREANKRSVSLGVLLPHEQIPNPYVTPELTFQFHYFAIRKMHFLMRAKALIAFPGGFGTFDELFETLTLLQTQKIDRIPLFLFGREYWNRVVNFEALVEEGMIGQADLELFNFVETADEAWKMIQDHYRDKQ